MIRDQFSLDINPKIIVDNFAGGGGASTGIELALGRHVDVAINHDPEAVFMHSINHPQTEHHCESVWDVDPREIADGRPVGLAWFSPDCKHFSKAKGGQPREKKIRGLAWIVLRWVATVKPEVIMLENVEEFRTWGPLLSDGQPDPKQKGRTFRSFINALVRHGYEVEHRELRACDYGAPTIRKRLFLIARCDGKPIVWPQPTHGDPASAAVKSGLLKPWRTAADCIDWSIPVKSIFERAKPLADATMKRIARGIQRYVLDSPKPYLITLAHGEGAGSTQRRGPGVRDLHQPSPTITASGGYGVVAPTVVKVNHAGDQFRGQAANMPMATITSKHGTALSAATLVQAGYGERAGQEPRALDVEKPLGTVVAGGVKHALVGASLIGAGGPAYSGKPRDIEQPIHTLTTESHTALVAPTLINTANSKTTGRGPNAWSVDEPLRMVTSAPGFALHAASLIKHYGGHYDGAGLAAYDPLHTVTTTDHHALLSAQLVGCGGRAGQSRPRNADEPIATLTAKADSCLVSANIVRQFGNSDAAAADLPVGTITAGGGGKTQLVASHVLKMRHHSTGQSCDQPIDTISAGGKHFGEVRAFLERCNGERSDAAITWNGERYYIADIGMRMLEPHELYAAQGFPESYQIAPVINGKRLSKAAQVRMCGNSVCPPLAAALVRANVPELAAWTPQELKKTKERIAA